MNRSFEKNIANLASKSPAIIIEGPKGYGKREMARRLFPNKKIVSFEEDYIRKLAEKSPKTFLLAFPEGLIILEAQRVKGIFEAVKYYIDLWGFSPARYVLTVSYRLQNIDPSFSRVALTGFTIDELIKLNKVSTNPFELLYKGQHPSLFTENFSPKLAIEDIVGASMSHPTRKINPSNDANFRNFLAGCARVSGQSLSMNQLARSTGVSAPTVKLWLAILLELGFASLVPCQKKGPTFFLHDSGLTCNLLGLASPSSVILDPSKDALVTAFALAELQRTRLKRNLDLNLTALVQNGQLYFMAKWERKYEIKLCPQLEVTEDYFTWPKTNQKKIILHLGAVTYTNKGVDCICWRDWPKFACELDYFS